MTKNINRTNKLVMIAMFSALAYVTTVVCKLSDSVQRWADAVLDSALTNDKHGNIEDYNMETAIRKLEILYR